MMRAGIIAVLVLALSAAAAAAQQIYRWTDERGRVHVTDTPPPPTATSVEKKNYGSRAPSADETPGMPYALAEAVKNFPVTLYTSPTCEAPCAQARAALNRRGVPFKEVQVWEQTSNEELKRVSGATQVPTLVVGRSVHKGFQQGAFDALLDSARYPRAGVLPERQQAAPAPPEGYVPPDSREAPEVESPSG